MTNLEKYVNTIINIRNQDSTDIAFAVDVKTGALRRCNEVGCKYCFTAHWAKKESEPYTA